MPRWSARILNSAWGFRSFLPHSGHISACLATPGEVGTTTNGGVLRLLAPLAFSEDRCVDRLLAVNANIRDHERDIAFNRHLLQHIRAGGRTRRLIRVLVPCAAFRQEQAWTGWVPHFSCALGYRRYEACPKRVAAALTSGDAKCTPVPNIS